MDRYISFEPYDQEGLIGGHTIILHSPEIIQNIRGVEFRKFGQQGNLGRYPLHFHLSENVDGSFAYKNLVRDSNQRCYVTHGTHNVTWQENVAFDTFGHCFLLEDGGEWDNKFLYNLAAVTKQPETIIRPEESDRVTTTSFWMTTMTNHFIGNVAAGSANIGFWFETMLREPSRSLSANEGITSTSRLPLGTFDDNVSDFCLGIYFLVGSNFSSSVFSSPIDLDALYQCTYYHIHRLPIVATGQAWHFIPPDISQIHAQR